MFDYLENENVTVEVLKRLLQDMNPNDTQNRFENNALHSYLFNENCNDVEVVKLLLDSGTDPLHKNWKQLTPLGEYTNLTRGKIDSDIVMALLDAVEYSNVNDFNIFNYMKSKNLDIGLIKILVDNGFDFTVKSADNYTVVDSYVMTDDPVPEIIDLLIENGSILEDDEYEEYSDNEQKDRTLLHLYVISHLYSNPGVRTDVVKCLIKHDIDPSSSDKDYCTALQYYIKSSHIDIDTVKLLMIGIDDVAYSYIDEDTCITRGIIADYLNSNYRYNKDVDFELLKLFLDNGKSHGIMCSIVPLWNNDNETISLILKKVSRDVIQRILIEYITFSHVDITLVELMLEYGAILDKEAIHGYFKNVHVDSYMMEYLLKKEGGSSVNDLDDGEIPMGQLCKPRYLYNCQLLSIINICLHYIKDINMRDKRGDTLLCYAVRYNKQSLVALLLTSGADVNIKSNNGYTCISICINESYNVEILKMLLYNKPTLNCMIDSLNGIDNIMDNTYAIKQCIKYTMIIYDESSKLPDSITKEYNNYIDLCNRELNEMKKIMVGDNTIFKLIFTNYGNKIIHRYSDNPELRKYYESNKNKIYVEVNDIISHAIHTHNKIHKTIIESIDDNTYISNLPYDIKYKIFEQ
ncbi:ankyrin/host range [Skunkpox virus]|uniref:Ankyrin/host range n=1 Tax=Skunkpox virus TaxID=160796 RepID=A0A1C9KBG8_9POXV|nr:ankyrin/host range [Skunkpox virus]AOP31495.1 ankyrin/host range [Skunkpox virus]